MDAATRKRVRLRAGDVCEYCGLSQDAVPFATFHIEHIIPDQHGGSDELSNLALACNHCNLHKGPNLSGIDPETGQIVPLFNPRKDGWHEHFELRGLMVVGLTPTGRATARVLAMNTLERLDLRAEIQAIDELP
jgi:hypothetical protein